MTAISVKTGVWKLSDIYDKINFGLTYSADDTPIPSGPEPGTLWVWGPGSYGALGVNNQIPYSSPVQLPGTQWTCSIIASSGAIALKCDGTLWNWGTNFLGVNTTANYLSSPVQIPGTSWCRISSGSGFVKGAIKCDGTMWTWGFNGSGRLGDNSTVNSSSPVQIPGTSWTCIAMGAASSALKSDGTLWSWGFNKCGMMGTNYGNNYSPFLSRSSPTQIPGTAWCYVGRGDNQAAALKTDGTLWVWGVNYYGALGKNNSVPNPTAVSSPTQIPGTSWVQVSTNQSGYIARKTDGTIWSWGYNSTGKVGDNSTTDRSSPVQIPGTSWTEVQGAGNTNVARKTDNTLWAWGQNYFGQFGNNTRGTAFYASSPVQVPGSWIDIGDSGNGQISARKSV